MRQRDTGDKQTPPSSIFNENSRDKIAFHIRSPPFLFCVENFDTLSPMQIEYAPPSQATGFRIFVWASYTAAYNFAVANYNAVSVKRKRYMRGGHLLLFRSLVAVLWIICMVFAILAFIKGAFVILTILFSLLYLVLSMYNIYVYFDNRDILNATCLLRANVAGPTGADYEWTDVPIDSRSANERLAAVNDAAIQRVRSEFAGSGRTEVKCLVYTKRYADTYPSFPKEVLVHMAAFLLAILIGIILATL